MRKPVGGGKGGVKVCDSLSEALSETGEGSSCSRSTCRGGGAAHACMRRREEGEGRKSSGRWRQRKTGQPDKLKSEEEKRGGVTGR
eukprot:760852-Hanusia_phi.AAC.5